jgi:hypothetical protein
VSTVVAVTISVVVSIAIVVAIAIVIAIASCSLGGELNTSLKETTGQSCHDIIQDDLLAIVRSQAERDGGSESVGRCGPHLPVSPVRISQHLNPIVGRRLHHFNLGGNVIIFSGLYSNPVTAGAFVHTQLDARKVCRLSKCTSKKKRQYGEESNFPIHVDCKAALNYTKSTNLQYKCYTAVYTV